MSSGNNYDVIALAPLWASTALRPHPSEFRVDAQYSDTTPVSPDF
jgi:hypothetical protein